MAPRPSSMHSGGVNNDDGGRLGPVHQRFRESAILVGPEHPQRWRGQGAADGSIPASRSFNPHPAWATGREPVLQARSGSRPGLRFRGHHHRSVTSCLKSLTRTQRSGLPVHAPGLVPAPSPPAPSGLASFGSRIATFRGNERGELATSNCSSRPKQKSSGKPVVLLRLDQRLEAPQRRAQHHRIDRSLFNPAATRAIVPVLGPDAASVDGSAGRAAFDHRAIAAT